MESESIKELKAIIRSLLISANRVITMDQLNKDYRESEGEYIPFRRLGFSSLEQFLRTIKDTISVHGSGPNAPVTYVASEKSNHIKDMIRGQRKPKNRSRKAKNFQNVNFIQNRNRNVMVTTQPKNISNVPTAPKQHISKYYYNQTGFNQRNPQNNKYTNTFCYQVQRIPNQCVPHLTSSFPTNNYNFIEKKNVDRFSEHDNNNNNKKKIDTADPKSLNINSAMQDKNKNLNNCLLSTNINTRLPAAIREVEPIPSPIIYNNTANIENGNKNAARENQYCQAKKIIEDDSDPACLEMPKLVLANLYKNNNPYIKKDDYTLQSKFRSKENQHGTQAQSALNQNETKNVCHMQKCNPNSNNKYQYQRRNAPKSKPWNNQYKRNIDNANKDGKENQYHRRPDSKHYSLNPISKIKNPQAKNPLMLAMKSDSFDDIDSLDQHFTESLSISKERKQNKQAPNDLLSKYILSKSYKNDTDNMSTASAFLNNSVTEIPDDMDEAIPSFAANDLVYRLDFPFGTVPFGKKIPDAMLPNNLAIDSVISIFICEIHDPFVFWFHLHDEHHELTTLMNHMKRFYEYLDDEDFLIPPVCISPGQICAALFQGMWHRAEVLRAPNSKNNAKVIFVDFGTVAEVKITEVKYLLIKFSTVPKQAFRGSLSHIKPRGLHWTIGSSHYFITHVSELLLFAKVSEIDRTNRILYMVICDTSDGKPLQVNKDLVDRGYGLFNLDWENPQTSETGLRRHHIREDFPTFEMLESGEYPSYSEIIEMKLNGIDYEGIYNRQLYHPNKLNEKLEATENIRDLPFPLLASNPFRVEILRYSHAQPLNKTEA